MKTVIIMSHPYYEKSKINQALFEAANSVDNVTVRHLEGIYGFETRKFDIAAEQKLLESADRIVFQFPMFWFGMPSILKAYIDEIFEYGWAYGSGEGKLCGKEFQIAVSLGGSQTEYSKEGLVKFSVNELLYSLHATADYCGMTFNKIFICDNASNVTNSEIDAYKKKYVKLLKNELEEE